MNRFKLYRKLLTNYKNANTIREINDARAKVTRARMAKMIHLVIDGRSEG